VKHCSLMLGNLVDHHHLGLERPQRHEVLILHRVAHHDQAIAAALDQEVQAIDGLVARIAVADAERHHHVQPAARSAV
jgi:hypothetical protein